MAPAGSRHEGERIDQTGLAAHPVSHHRYIPDLRSAVLWHWPILIRSGTCADSRRVQQPGAESILFDVADTAGQIHGNCAARLSHLADASKDRDVWPAGFPFDEGRAPRAAKRNGENALPARGAVGHGADGLPWHATIDLPARSVANRKGVRQGTPENAT